MLRHYLLPLRGTIVGVLCLSSMMMFALLIIICTLIGLLMPFPSLRAWWQGLGFALFGWFVDVNNVLVWDVHIDLHGTGVLLPNSWTFLFSNHRSWVDILILLRVFHRRLPALRFFMKQELLWLPLGGLACRALGFPFLSRYQKSDLKKTRVNKHADMDIIRKACAVCRTRPSVLACFIEGTRYTYEKKQRQQSPYKHLLKPKSGGLALALQGLGDQLQTIVDVTIIYPKHISLWDYLCGRIKKTTVYYDAIPVDDRLRKLGASDRSARRDLNRWFAERWQKKDQCIEDTYRDA